LRLYLVREALGEGVCEHPAFRRRTPGFGKYGSERCRFLDNGVGYDHHDIDGRLLAEEFPPLGQFGEAGAAG
jgi:hypothetical protein